MIKEYISIFETKNEKLRDENNIVFIQRQHKIISLIEGGPMLECKFLFK